VASSTSSVDKEPAAWSDNLSHSLCNAARSKRHVDSCTAHKQSRGFHRLTVKSLPVTHSWTLCICQRNNYTTATYNKIHDTKAKSCGGQRQRQHHTNASTNNTCVSARWSWSHLWTSCLSRWLNSASNTLDCCRLVESWSLRLTTCLRSSSTNPLSSACSQNTRPSDKHSTA